SMPPPASSTVPTRRSWSKRKRNSSRAGRSSSTTSTTNPAMASPYAGFGVSVGGEFGDGQCDLRARARRGLDHQAVVITEGGAQALIHIAQSDGIDFHVAV